MASSHVACPSCGAATKPGDPWCTLCFADLRPKPVPAPPRPAPQIARPLPISGGPPAPPSAITALSTGAVSTRPLPEDVPTPAEVKAMTCPTCGDPMPIVAEVCPACGESPFARLRSTTQLSLKLPVVGDLMRFDRGMRYVVALVFAVATAAIVVGLVYLVGLVL